MLISSRISLYHKLGFPCQGDRGDSPFPLAPRGVQSTKPLERIQQKHPVSAEEVRGWIENNGFTIERNFGNTSDEPYRPDLNRATFWARKDDMQ